MNSLVLGVLDSMSPLGESIEPSVVAGETFSNYFDRRPVISESEQFHSQCVANAANICAKG
jgi:hypothetical protein